MDTTLRAAAERMDDALNLDEPEEEQPWSGGDYSGRR
jgi:hypothetical protein